MHVRNGAGRRLVGSVIALGLMVAAIAGCGGGSGSGSNGSSASTKIKPTVTAGKAKGDIATLKWALPAGEPPSLDPSQAVSFSSAVVVSNLCDTLLRQRADTTLEPGAAKLERLSPTTFLFTLNHGIKFWDGHEASAEDLLFSLEWAARPLSIGAATYENVRSMKITGPDQVTVALNKPDALFELELGSPVTAALIEKSYTEKEGNKFGTAEGGIMCSGPFELAAWKQGQEIVLTRNENYWDPAFKAHAKTVSLKFLSDSAALAQGLASGEVEGAYGVPPAVIPKLSDTANGSLYYGNSQEFVTMSVTTPDSVMNERALFRALSLSIDREAVAKAIYHEAAKPNYTLVGTNSWTPAAEGPWKEAYPAFVKRNAYDPEEAKKLVEQSEYHGQPINVVVPAGDETLSQFAQLVQQEASQIGLDIKIVSTQPTQYETMSYTASARKGTDIYVGKSYNSIKNPLELLPLVMIPKQYYNYTDYDNPKVTDLIETARETLSAQKRSELLVEAQALYESEKGEVTAVTPYTITFLNKGLAGAVTDGTWMWTPSLATIGAAG